MEPHARLGLGQLTRLAFAGEDLAPLRAELFAHCTQNLGAAGALMDLSVIEQLNGQQIAGLELQELALQSSRVFRTERNGPKSRRLAVFCSAIQMGGNTPVELLLADADYEVLTVYPISGAPKDVPLPDFDVGFCAAPADAEEAEHFFDTVREMTKRHATKVLNLPDKLVKLDRDGLQQIFRFVDGLRLPATERFDRGDLMRILAWETEETSFAPLGGFPLVVRPVGSHAGVGLEKIHDGDALLEYLSKRDEEVFFVSEFIDYASASDGRYRKYRVVFVGGQAFPCHMAIADQWDVWYMNADMAASPEKLREEADFMARFDAEFARRHKGSFDAIMAGVGLDYFGIDCAEDAEGNLIVFEADNALIVHNMDSEEVFPYKRAHMERIFAGFEAMLDHAGRDQTSSEDRSLEVGWTALGVAAQDVVKTVPIAVSSAPMHKEALLGETGTP